MEVLEHPCKKSLCLQLPLLPLPPCRCVCVPPSSQAGILELSLHSRAGLWPGAFGAFPPCWSGLIICRWRAREMGGNHEVPAGAAEIQLPEAQLARANLCQVWQTIRCSKYTFISIRKNLYLLRAMKNLEPACAMKGLICCWYLINKAVVYLFTFPCSNCERISDVLGHFFSLSTVKQMFC